MKTETETAGTAKGVGAANLANAKKYKRLSAAAVAKKLKKKCVR
jgi:hypothetical protein